MLRCIGSCILECEKMVDHLHMNTHAWTDPDTHTHMSAFLAAQKCLDMKNSSIPNVLQRRPTAAAGLPEVVAPFSHTVGLIHTHQGQGHEGGKSLQQHCAVQPLWGHIQHPQPACLHHSHMCCVVLCCVVLCCVVLCCVVLCCVVLCPPCLVGGCCRMGCGRHGGELPFSSKGRKVQWEKSWRGERQMGRKA